jgi:DNA-binding Xre family transcriptional regulator
MASGVDYEWQLRALLADRGVFSSAELVPLLAEHGVRLSDTQVWRLVTGKPQRLNLHTLMVLCEILECTPSDQGLRLRRRRREAVHVANLRRKIEPEGGVRQIRTEPGVGYRFAS